MSCDKIKCAAVIVALLTKKKMEAKKKRIWVRKWIEKRNSAGFHNRLFRELENDDPRSLKNFMRMSMDDFKILVDLISPKISKRETNMRAAIPPSERLLVTLRFLATGK